VSLWGGTDKFVCPWERVRVMNKIITICGIIFLSVVIFNSNAYPFWGSKYLAKVNDEAITVEDFKDRLKEFHKNPESVRDASREFDYRRFLDRIIDERLMIQEAYRLELDKRPDFIKRMKAKELFVFMTRLRMEEITDKKIVITEEEIKDIYNKDYAGSGVEKASDIPEKIRVKLDKRIKKNKIRQRENEYRESLKEGAGIEIYEGLLNSVGEGDYPQGGDKVIADVDGESISVNEFLNELRYRIRKKEKGTDIDEVKREALDYLIVRRLLIREAMKRGQRYKKDPEVYKRFKRYKELQLIDKFKKDMIYPMIRFTDDELMDYYDSNKERFMKSDRVMLDLIEVKGENKAKELRGELIKGANFSMLAREKSIAPSADKGGDIGWVSINSLTPVIAEAIKEIKVNEITDIIPAGQHSLYMIIKLNRIERGTLKGFSEVRDEIYMILGKQRYDSLLDRYRAELRKGSSIKINEKSLRRLK